MDFTSTFSFKTFQVGKVERDGKSEIWGKGEVLSRFLAILGNLSYEFFHLVLRYTFCKVAKVDISPPL